MWSWSLGVTLFADTNSGKEPHQGGGCTVQRCLWSGMRSVTICAVSQLTNINFHPWEIAFTIFNGLYQGEAKARSLSLEQHCWTFLNMYYNFDLVRSSLAKDLAYHRSGCSQLMYLRGAFFLHSITRCLFSKMLLLAHVENVISGGDYLGEVLFQAFYSSFEAVDA